MTDAQLTYGIEFTKNLGNFENVKPRFELTIPVSFKTNDELDELKRKLVDRVDAWFVEAVEELVEEAGKAGLGK